jgi:hypothetical protein
MTVAQEIQKQHKLYKELKEKKEEKKEKKEKKAEKKAEKKVKKVKEESATKIQGAFKRHMMIKEAKEKLKSLKDEFNKLTPEQQETIDSHLEYKNLDTKEKIFNKFKELLKAKRIAKRGEEYAKQSLEDREILKKSRTKESLTEEEKQDLTSMAKLSAKETIEEEEDYKKFLLQKKIDNALVPSVSKKRREELKEIFEKYIPEGYKQIRNYNYLDSSVPKVIIFKKGKDILELKYSIDIDKGWHIVREGENTIHFNDIVKEREGNAYYNNKIKKAEGLTDEAKKIYSDYLKQKEYDWMASTPILVIETIIEDTRDKKKASQRIIDYEKRRNESFMEREKERKKRYE